MIKKHIWQIILVVYILFIFSNSLTPAAQSSAESGFVLQLAHDILRTLGMGEASWLTEHIIRKGAHFTEYALMGILLFQSMKTLDCGIVLLRKAHQAGVFMIPFVDETLQLFTEGRSGQISDVWLDMSGVLTGLAAACLAALCWRMWREGKSREKSPAKNSSGNSGKKQQREKHQ